MSERQKGTILNLQYDLEQIATTTISQHLNKDTMIVNLKVMAREALTKSKGV